MVSCCMFFHQTETFGHRVYETVAWEGQHHPTDCQSRYPDSRRVPTVQETGQLSCAKSCPFTLLIKKKARRDSRSLSLRHHVCLECFAICQSIISAGTMSRSAALPPRRERSEEKIWAHPQINKQRMFLNPKQSLLDRSSGCCVLARKKSQRVCVIFTVVFMFL